MTPWTRDVPFETIAEKLHSQKGYKVGILSTVNIDHATPAAFYAHQASRKNYYEIGEELANSGFEYFAGGDFQDPRGGAVSNYDMAIAKGYKLVTTQAGAAALKAGDKALVIAEQRADAAAMNYSIDAAAGEWQLSDYVRKGIEVLDNPNGFFMMAESGKIDWACHANDTAASIHDVLEMSNAVQVAVDFPGHRRPRDRRHDHRLHHHQLRHLSDQPDQADHVICQVRQHHRHPARSGRFLRDGHGRGQEGVRPHHRE